MGVCDFFDKEESLLAAVTGGNRGGSRGDSRGGSRGGVEGTRGELRLAAREDLLRNVQGSVLHHLNFIAKQDQGKERGDDEEERGGRRGVVCSYCALRACCILCAVCCVRRALCCVLCAVCLLRASCCVYYC